METKSKYISLKAILVAIGAGIWVIVLQNAGIISKLVGTENGTQTVYVTGGNIDADVSGNVSVDNTVDVNIEEILGRKAGTKQSYVIDGVQYNSWMFHLDRKTTANNVYKIFGNQWFIERFSSYQNLL